VAFTSWCGGAISGRLHLNRVLGHNAVVAAAKVRWTAPRDSHQPISARKATACWGALFVADAGGLKFATAATWAGADSGVSAPCSAS
jgi:hypothetical protein